MRIESITKGLATYSGRDSCVRITAYFTLFVFGATKLMLDELDYSNDDEKSKRDHLFSYIYLSYLSAFLTVDGLKHLNYSSRLISKHFATTRLILRFFDDIPAIFNLYKHFFMTQPPKSTTTTTTTTPKTRIIKNKSSDSNISNKKDENNNELDDNDNDNSNENDEKCQQQNRGVEVKSSRVIIII